jgi:uncharacterized secreted protein with C-terminal beta-propeller domain
MNSKTALVMLSAMGLAALGGCSGAKPENVGEVRAQLHRAKSCSDLHAMLQADARAKVNEFFDRQIAQIRRYKEQGYTSPMAPEMSAGGDAKNAGTASPAPSDQSRASSFSETNVQVKGVDEADIVKTDGKSIFLLHGTSFMVLNAWPASTLATQSSIAIEGQPTEMYVDNGRVVVYSNVDGRPIYDAAGVKYRNEYNDYWYGGYGGSRGGADIAAPGGAPSPYGGYVPQPLTKITVLTLAGTTPSVARELYFEGRYLSSRRVGNHVRTVLQGGAHGPTIKTYWDYSSGQTGPQTADQMIAAYEQLRSDNLRAVGATVVNDWLPYQFAKNGASVQASSVACEDYYVPTAGTTQYGMTQVQSIDLGNLGAMPKGTAIVGNVDTVYASTGAMYLASRAWNQEPLIEMPMAGGGDTAVGAPAQGGTVDPAPSTGGTGTRTVRWWDRRTPVTLNYTHVHKLEFKTDPSFPNYVASGTVAGQIKDQFSMDEKDGVLRISTTENRLMVDSRNANSWSGSRGSYNHVFALGHESDWLKKIGDAGDMAPGEQIYSTRFLGNRAYVVTFRQVDPLHVVDMANPRQPRVLGELTIPGFSTYMHPIDENTLLTIGRDSGKLQLQIFDVSDPMRPQQKHKFMYDGAANYGYSEAEQNHKAFTYFADRKLLAFPYYGYNQTGMRSSLEVFKVDAGAGFTRVGAVDHTDFMQQNLQNTRNGYCGGYYSPMVRRGIFMENFVYSISYGGVKAHDVGDLAGAGNQVALPLPGVPTYYNGGQAVMACAAQ